MKQHKKSFFQTRKTVCGIFYYDIKNMADFVVNHTVGSWKKVTCKTCLTQRRDYDKKIRGY